VTDDDEPALHPKRLEDPEASCPRHPDKNYRRLVEAAWDAGWWCRRAKNNHILCYPPRRADERERGAVSVPSTPRKQGTLGLTAGKFKKLGLDV
jgi:hypothetical protein